MHRYHQIGVRICAMIASVVLLNSYFSCKAGIPTADTRQKLPPIANSVAAECDSFKIPHAVIFSKTILSMLDSTVMRFVAEKHLDPDATNIYIRYFADNRRQGLDSLERTLMFIVEKTDNEPWTNSWAAWTELNGFTVFLDNGSFERFAYQKGVKKKWFYFGKDKAPTESYYWEFKREVTYSPFKSTDPCVRFKPSHDYDKMKENEFYNTDWDLMIADGDGERW